MGCGHGSAVAALRGRGHRAVGIDPTPEILAVALECFDPDWFRAVAVEHLPDELAAIDLPDRFDVVMATGNVPALLSDDTLTGAFLPIAKLLCPGGLLVIGTTTAARGGPEAQLVAAAACGLTLIHRFADWHLSVPSDELPWSVTVFQTPGTGDPVDTPDGIFVLQQGSGPAVLTASLHTIEQERP
ncbi:methyltransferase domain-containing protein [Cryobacterium sp. PH31-L1]|uniref:class I SAM-dependent methyltransferase n=1 Tax=Cryobacterium sp. PH31-L1 TaxID=3046199 RepID=UPI0024BBA919|nr:methyltransferase domain-containing protein [Cryobacterium sp. PH31-L1]MDJ0376287.1 methyltransferase domain-containing protein [Cryobacterium sp. PH31-L1]